MNNDGDLMTVNPSWVHEEDLKWDEDDWEGREERGQQFRHSWDCCVPFFSSRTWCKREERTTRYFAHEGRGSMTMGSRSLLFHQSVWPTPHFCVHIPFLSTIPSTLNAKVVLSPKGIDYFAQLDTAENCAMREQKMTPSEVIVNPTTLPPVLSLHLFQ